jgi:carbamoyl-phosphate synthase large subunit
VTSILFTGGGGASSEALYRLLSGCYEVHFADADPEARPYGVPSDAWHAIPWASEPTFVRGLGDLCCELNVGLLIPGVDEELEPIANARATLGCPVLLPEAEFVRIHLDKLASNQALKALGASVPETETVSERRRVAFPCIVKPRRGRGSRAVAVVRSEEELLAHITSTRLPAGGFIVQERLDGQEFTVTMVADRSGTLRAVVPVKVRIKRGITLRAETDRDAAVMEACAAIHAASPASGCFNIQLVKTTGGEVKPFEINPRISTTTCLALAAGVDFVGLYLGPGQSPRGHRVALAPFQERLQLRRSWHNEFLKAE